MSIFPAWRILLLCLLSTQLVVSHAFHGRPRRHRHHDRRFFENRHNHRAHGHAHSRNHHDAHRLYADAHKLVSESHVVENSLGGNRVPHTSRKGGHGSRWALTYQGAAHEPTAINNTVSNVTAQLGGAAFLPCRVGHLGDRQISWIRKRDWHVLTSGEVLYTPDRRFSVLHVAGSQDWTLHIKYVGVKDNGTYECQVSTGTGIISLFVNLAVVTPEAHIPGHGQYHVNRGSPITLVCAVENVPTPPQYVFWYHNGRLLNYLPDQPGVTIDTAREPNSAVSTLEVQSARDYHSGNYTCTASNTIAASTMVFVTEGDKTAAVQRIDSNSAAASGPPAALLLLAASYVLAVR
ncbi:zwei Ig domain protein zig-8-like [Penaeus japonicus]|uniref:zwei Ig domain protein zig-8-like n=1 Tax=Penaeus japonicus TaxID=27405 RepID=UPI001C70B12A|nr:zwei Ig domain protein zig-8-like [Penaeus japonicus]